MPAGVVPADPAPRPNVRDRWQLHARALSWQFSGGCASCEAACISLGRASLGMVLEYMHLNPELMDIGPTAALTTSGHEVDGELVDGYDSDESDKERQER